MLTNLSKEFFFFFYSVLLLFWLNPPPMLPLRTFSCWADLPMSGLETTSCNFPSTCASAHTVSRTLWSWSGCCWLWLEQKMTSKLPWPQNAPPLNRRYWLLHLLLCCNIQQTIWPQHPVVLLSTISNSLLFRKPILEFWVTVFTVQKCLLNQVDI